jgi:IclR family KDG regulon transcriptional repressor
MLLAGLSEEQLDALGWPDSLQRFTPNTIATPAELKTVLAQARANGYATDNEEHTIGVRCFAMPIRNHTGHTAAALSVSFPTVRFTPERGERALALLGNAVAAISRDLGYGP